MERVLKILVIGIFAFLLILWISTVFTTCNSKKSNEITQTEQQIDSLDNAEEIDLDEDIFSDTEDEEKAANNNTKTEEENIDDYIDYSGDAEKSTTNKKKAKASTSSNNASTASKPKQKKQVASNSNGRYLVVAGSYLVKDNAIKMKNRLYDLGYSSEIVNFDLSQYYSVLAGRYNTRGSAKEVVSILKRNDIAAYVHKKK